MVWVLWRENFLLAAFRFLYQKLAWYTIVVNFTWNFWLKSREKSNSTFLALVTFWQISQESHNRVESTLLCQKACSNLAKYGKSRTTCSSSRLESKSTQFNSTIWFSILRCDLLTGWVIRAMQKNIWESQMEYTEKLQSLLKWEILHYTVATSHREEGQNCRTAKSDCFPKNSRT